MNIFIICFIYYTKVQNLLTIWLRKVNRQYSEAQDRLCAVPYDAIKRDRMFRMWRARGYMNHGNMETFCGFVVMAEDESDWRLSDLWDSEVLELVMARCTITIGVHHQHPATTRRSNILIRAMRRLSMPVRETARGGRRRGRRRGQRRRRIEKKGSGG